MKFEVDDTGKKYIFLTGYTTSYILEKLKEVTIVNVSKLKEVYLLVTNNNEDIYISLLNKDIVSQFMK